MLGLQSLRANRLAGFNPLGALEASRDADVVSKVSRSHHSQSSAQLDSRAPVTVSAGVLREFKQTL